MKCGHGRVPPPCSAPCWRWPAARRAPTWWAWSGLAENMPSGHRAAAGRRGPQHGRQDDRGHQHRRRGPARARGRALVHAGALQAQGDDRPRHADRGGGRGARPRAGRPVRNDEALAKQLLDRRRGDRRAAVAAAARQGLREAHQVRHRRHQECRPRPRGRQHRRCGVPAAVRRRHALGASRHRRPWPGPRATCR